jgi:hypothetical protein
MTKRVMWWNLPIEEVEELMQEKKLTSMTCVEYDDEEKEKEKEKEREENNE